MLERKSVSEFLGELESRLRPTLDDHYLQQVLSEAETHLRESCDELIALGVSPVEAEAAAVAAFGRPKFAAKSTVAAKWIFTAAVVYGAIAIAVAANHLDGFGGGLVEPAKLAATLGSPLLVFFGLGFLGARPHVRTLAPVVALGAFALLVLLPAHYVIRTDGWDLQRILPAVESRFYAEVRLKDYRDPGSNWSVSAADQRDRAYQRAFNLFLAGRPITVGPNLPWSPIGEPLTRMTPENAKRQWTLFGKGQRDAIHDYLVSSKRNAGTLGAGLRWSYRERLLSMSPWSIVLPLAWLLAVLAAQAAGYGFMLARQALRRRTSVV